MCRIDVEQFLDLGIRRRFEIDIPFLTGLEFETEIGTFTLLQAAAIFGRNEITVANDAANRMQPDRKSDHHGRKANARESGNWSPGTPPHAAPRD